MLLFVCVGRVLRSKFGYLLCFVRHSNMDLQLGLKELALDSRAHSAHSISPFPSTSTNPTHSTTTFNQSGFGHGRIGPFLPQGGTSTGPASEIPVSFTFSDGGGSSYLSSGSGDCSMVSLYIYVFSICTDNIL